jgi:hypothetical protein
MIKPSQAITVGFETARFDTGAAADATGTPTGTLVKNGTDTAETVTVTNKATGSYKAAFTLPADAAAGDVFELRVEATVNSVAGKATVWRGVVDTKRVGDLQDLTAAAVNAEADAALADAGVTTTVTGRIDAAVSSRSTLTAQQVWEYATRSLTTFGSLVADMVAAVWGAVTRTLTAGTKDAEIDAIKAKTDGLPADPAGVSDLPAAAPSAAAVRAEIDANSTQLAAIVDRLLTDAVIDTTTTPWTLKVYKAGTATLLATKELKQLSGDDVTSASQAIGSQVEAAG